MADLTDPQKHRMVLLLAQYEGLTDICRMFKEDFGVEMVPRQVGSYDPTRPYFDAGERWAKLFYEERERYVTEVRDIPIANQGFRLRQLQRTFDHANKIGNRGLANQTLRQAAEEVGGALTNERNVKVSRPVDELTPEERRSALADLIAKALAAGDPKAAQPDQPTTH